MGPGMFDGLLTGLLLIGGIILVAGIGIGYVIAQVLAR